MANFPIFRLGVYLALSFSLILTGCLHQDETPVKIGVVLPFTGEFKIYGDAGLRGAQMAVDEINAAGGVLNGRRLKLITTDNKTDPSESIRLARRLIQSEQVTALLGPVSSAARNAILEEARKFQVPLLYGIDYEGGEYDRYLICYSTIPDHYVNPVVPYLLGHYGKRIYIFGYDYIWPHKMSEAIERAIDSAGGEVVGKEFTAFGVKDFSPVIERIRSAKADLLMLIQPGTDGFRFIQQFSAAGQKQQTRILAFAADESYLNALSPNDLEGIFSGLHFFSSLNTSEARRFITRFRDTFPDAGDPTYAAEAHYRLIKLFAAAIEKAGSTERERIIDAMEGQTMLAGGGEIRLRSDHHFDLPMFLGEFTDGKLLVRKALGTVKPADQRNNTL
jgi:ABC-type branched-subunit amino acid transport system substrate-binding protein